MRVRDYRLALAWLALAGLLASGVWQWLGYAADARYNAAVAAGDLDFAGEHEGARGALARAAALQVAGRRSEALAAYGDIELPVGDDTLADMRRYNLGLIWLDQALAHEANEEAELGLPLAELAKQAWRDVLSHEPDAFDARYNLALALQVLPEMGRLVADEDIMPERSPRAPQAARALDRLP